ncbi:MAG: hypothetical protein GWP05_02720 [Anaerolineaceae bacterium]|nr:hypothetical protein [Anaerolineaceae bacterium]
MKTQRLTTNLAIAGMLMGMAGLVLNVFGFFHYISILSRADIVVDDDRIRSIYVFMNIPLKVSLVVCSIALLYRCRWGRPAMTVVGLVSIAHSTVATVMLQKSIVHYLVQIAGLNMWVMWVKGWDWVVLAMVLLFYGFIIWHLHRKRTREEFRLAASEAIDWTGGEDT